MSGIPQHVLAAAEQADADLDNWVNGDDTGSGNADLGDGDEFKAEAALEFEDFGDIDSEFQSGNGDGSDDPLDYSNVNADPNAVVNQSGSDDGTNWQQRAQVAEGRLKALGPQVAMIPQLQQQITQLQQAGGGTDVQAAVQAALAEERQKQDREAQRQHFRSQLADEFGLGDEGVDAMDQYIGSMLPQQPVANNTQQQAQPRQGEVSQASQPESTEAMYRQAVFAAHPNFNSINNDPGFHGWLQGVDTDGISRSAKLGQAHQSMNSSMVIQLVNQYLINVGQQGQQQTQRQAAVQRQIAPSRSRGGTGQPQQQQRYLTPQQIQGFYDRFNRGEYHGKAEQWAKIERLIEASEQFHLQGG